MSVRIHPSASSILSGNARVVEDDKALFLESFERAARYALQDGVSHVDLYLADRGENGWLQYSLYVRKADGSTGLYIACMQRDPNAELEFCS